MKALQVGGNPGRAKVIMLSEVQVATQWARAAAMSGRSCSDARTVFFKGEAQLFHGPPDRRQTGGRAQGDLQVREGARRRSVDAYNAGADVGDRKTTQRPASYSSLPLESLFALSGCCHTSSSASFCLV